MKEKKIALHPGIPWNTKIGRHYYLLLMKESVRLHLEKFDFSIYEATLMLFIIRIV